MSQTMVRIFATCPQSSAVERDSYLQNVKDVARWSEEAGCEGILVYSDNSQVNPWLVTQIIIQNTTRLCPLVALQPAYMHPYSVANLISSLAHLHGRRIHLNLLAGGFKNDLTALNDMTPHDKRYERLVEYTTIIRQLLASQDPVIYSGEFYVVNKLKIAPPLPHDLMPGLFVSGSSEAGMRTATVLGATAVKYPQPAECERADPAASIPYGIRVGIVAREREEKAWQVAHARFPEDRKGQLTHQLAMKTSDSAWHRQLSELGSEADSPYWLWPFENYKTFCPYLVGNYERVAAELAKYMDRGYATFILDIPPNQEELEHISLVFSRAKQLVNK
jgi:alkanesulfonate monooxygenase